MASNAQRLFGARLGESHQSEAASVLQFFTGNTGLSPRREQLGAHPGRSSGARASSARGHGGRERTGGYLGRGRQPVVVSESRPDLFALDVGSGEHARRCELLVRRSGEIAARATLAAERAPQAAARERREGSRSSSRSGKSRRDPDQPPPPPPGGDAPRGATRLEALRADLTERPPSEGRSA